MDIDKQQREYFLHQQMKTIQDELGGNPTDEEIKELEELAETKEWNGMSGRIFNKELNKLKRLNPSSPDYSVQSNYLREMLDLPWNHLSGGQPGSGTCTPGTGCRSFRTGESKRKNFRILSGFKVKSRYEIADSVPLRPSGE